MKRPLIIIGIVVLAAAMVRVAELILERGLDARLPPLLTDTLGQEVTIAPIRADILSLTAHTDTFRMGSADGPSLLARNVKVSLNWTDLLRGEIRLVTGAGADLLLDLSRWPGSDDPLPDDYRYLEPWLPSSLDLDSGHIVLDGGGSLTLRDARWRRPAKGASLAGRLIRPAGELDIDIELTSLEDLLALRTLDTRIGVATDKPQVPRSELTFTVNPVEAGGYRLDLSGSLAGMNLTAEAESSERWRWPQRSDTQLQTVRADTVRQVLSLLFSDNEDEELEQELATPLPALSLPFHRARLRAAELRMGSEMLHDVDIRLSMQRNFLALTRINAEGLYGSLRGSAAVASLEDSWEVALGADIFARELDRGLMGRYVESHWYASDGSIRLTTRGGNPEELLNDLRGTLEATGAHRGDAETPVGLKARLDGSREKFALEELELRAGSSTMTGAFEFVGGDTDEIRLELDSEGLDITFLIEPAEADDTPGLLIPTYLAALPSYRLLVDIDIANLVLPALTMESARLNADRGITEGHVKLALKGEAEGTLSANLDYNRSDVGEAFDTTLHVELDKVHLSDLFSYERGPLDSRTSGSLDFSGSGRNVEEVFASLRGKASLQEHLRRNGEWDRDSGPEEIITVGGIASLVIEGSSIVGLQIDELDIDSLRQDISGTLSLVGTRNPVFEADLASERLDLDMILELLPASPEGADDEGVLQTLRTLGPARLNIRANTLKWSQHAVEDLRLSLLAGDNSFSVEQLDFTHQGASIDSEWGLTWQGETASLRARGNVDKLQVTHLVSTPPQQLAQTLEAPLQGGFKIDGSGETLAALLSGLEGHIKLDSGPGDSTQVVDVDFQRLRDGGRIDVNQLRLAGSDLRGQVKRSPGSPDRFEITLGGGILDMRPWEPDRQAATPEESKSGDDTGALEQTADAARGLLGFTAKLLNPAGFQSSGERVFDDQPMNVGALSAFDIHLSGNLDRALSRFAEVDKLTVDASLGDGRLTVVADADAFNGGPVHIDFSFDGAGSPYALEVSGTAKGIHRRPERSSFPSSLEVSLSSRGTSEAELAADLKGQIFVAFGEGPIDYGAVALLNRDVAAGMFRTLIPGAERKPPKMQCGVTLIEFADGLGITPYGYAVRTGTANLLGGMELNLKKEKMRIKFQSRSREGVGISIGNAFSNSVELAGPLSNPQIVPNTTGLLVRGWAAFATGGLSILGESFFNRALASKNPCKSVEEEMRKTICQSGHPLAASPLACPKEPEKAPPQHEAIATP